MQSSLMSVAATTPSECTTPKIGDIVTVRQGVNDPFFYELDGKPSRWRVSGYLRMVVPPPLDPTDPMTPVLESALGEYLTKPRTYWCTREEAEFLSLVGVAGATVKVADCIVVGRVSWPADLIQSEESSATRRAGNPAL